MKLSSRTFSVPMVMQHGKMARRPGIAFLASCVWVVPLHCACGNSHDCMPHRRHENNDFQNENERGREKAWIEHSVVLTKVVNLYLAVSLQMSGGSSES